MLRSSLLSPIIALVAITWFVAGNALAVRPPVSTAPYVVTTAAVHLRQRPRLAGRVLEILPRGAKLHFHAYHVSWAAVTAPDGKVGYVSRRYLGTVRVPGYAAPFIVVSVRAANVRVTPRLDAPILFVVHRGAILAGGRVTGSWLAVETSSGRTGWISRRLTHAR